VKELLAIKRVGKVRAWWGSLHALVENMVKKNRGHFPIAVLLTIVLKGLFYFILLKFDFESLSFEVPTAFAFIDDFPKHSVSIDMQLIVLQNYDCILTVIFMIYIHCPEIPISIWQFLWQSLDGIDGKSLGRPGVFRPRYSTPIGKLVWTTLIVSTLLLYPH